MDRYRKLIVTLCFLLSVNNLIQSQIISIPIFDSTYCYLILNDNHNKVKKRNNIAFKATLFIQNESIDTIFVTDFNKYIHHISSGQFKETEKRAFYWNLLTVSNEDPELLDEDPLVITVYNPVIKIPKEKNVDIVIPPHELYVSDIIMLRSLLNFRVYPQGYYKLCLYHSENETNKRIAETIIEIK